MKRIAPTNADATLESIGRKLITEIRNGGYLEYSYLSAGNGFALLTRLERIEEDGRPRPSADRFNVTVELKPNSILSLKDYLNALLRAPAGHYRIVVFIVDNNPIMQTDSPIDARSLTRIWDEGANTLPPELGDKRIKPSDKYHCTALIYEFEKVGAQPATSMRPSNIQGEDHLIKAGLQNLVAP